MLSSFLNDLDGLVLAKEKIFFYVPDVFYTVPIQSMIIDIKNKVIQVIKVLPWMNNIIFSLHFSRSHLDDIGQCAKAHTTN